MKRDETLLEARRLYISKRINKAGSVAKEVKSLSKRLFISESTIYADLKVTTTTKVRIDIETNRK